MSPGAAGHISGLFAGMFKPPKKTNVHHIGNPRGDLFTVATVNPGPSGNPGSGNTPPKTPRTRRIVLQGPNGGSATNQGTIDITDIPNADARAPFTVAVQQRCDLGGWHNQDTVTLPFWGTD